jgi:glycosyltransferase involved in cell wall biosynthesis
MTESPRLLYIDDIPTPYRLGVHRVVVQRWPGVYKVLFMADSEPGRDWELDFTGLNIETLAGGQIRPPGQVNPFSFKWNPMAIQAINEFRPDVVVLSGYIHPTVIRAARWCLTRRLPYAVACETSCRSTSCSGWRWNARRILLAWIVRNMAFGLPVGREAADYLRRFGPSDAPMHYFPNTPDTSAIAAEADEVRSKGLEQELRRTLALPPDAAIILFVGRLIDAKRPMDALEAFGLLDPAAHDAVLVVVGDGPMKSTMMEKAVGRKVVFTGWIRDQKQMAGLMSIARMLVLPSFHEPWGAVVNEALAAGTPVIASDRVTSAVELIEQGRNGLLYPVSDIAALAAAMTNILSLDQDRSEQMSAAARETATRFGHEFAAGNLIKGAAAAICDQRPALS